MELRAAVAATAHDSSHGFAILCLGNRLRANRRSICMDEVEIGLVLDTLEQWVLTIRLHLIPSHVRDGVSRFRVHSADSAWHDTQALRIPFFRLAVQQLHAEANPEYGLAQ